MSPTPTIVWHSVSFIISICLTQVDSSVGGKTGINHPLGKNLLGAFYQPQCVLVDTDTLNTLPDRELASGIAEVVKYGLIRDAAFFEWLENNMQSLLARYFKVSFFLFFIIFPVTLNMLLIASLG